MDARSMSASETAPGAGEILFKRRGAIGLITLNRPKALNALTLEMIAALDPQLDAWAADPAVGAVVIQGVGERAFCAGGDVRALYDSRGKGDRAYRADFYRREYRQNRRIFRFPKPYIALMDGITMGGGVGVAVHGSHRIVTERSLFAMPETGIGLFPDVGGGYFLPRLPGSLGLYLGLTGARLKAADCLHAGIATHFLPSERLEALTVALAEGDLGGGGKAVDRLLAPLQADPGPAALSRDRAAIDRCFGERSVEAILAALAADGGDWAKATSASLASKSPTSLKLTLRQLARGRGLSFEEVMIMEYRLCQYCMDGHDFFEGVRAVIIDRDNAPKWQPPTLAGVSEAELERAFAPRADDLIFN
jgi:enoyl-CoA hydratase